MIIAHWINRNGMEVNVYDIFWCNTDPSWGWRYRNEPLHKSPNGKWVKYCLIVPNFDHCGEPVAHIVKASELFLVNGEQSRDNENTPLARSDLVSKDVP